MWIGRGFDVDGDGENDVVVVQHLSRADQRAIGKALGVIILTVIAVGGLGAIAYGICLTADWVQTNAAILKAMLFWGAISAAILFALLLMSVGILLRPTPANRAEPSHIGSHSTAARRSQRKPCRKCGHLVTDAFLRCPACTATCPYPS
jgi:hypothetical protein